MYPVTIDPLSTGINGTADWIGDDAIQPSSFFGYSVSSAGDVNGDGYSDVIMGAYGYDEAFTVNEGQAFVYHGSITGLSATPDAQLDDGNQNGALFGRSVACAGDVNGDGYSDVIIGADMHNDPPYTREGRAYIYYGSATGLAAFYGTTLKDADQADANFGWSVAAAGDVNGDGYSDVVVGAYSYDDGFTNEGKAFVYYGSSTGLQTAAAVTLADADQVDAQFGVSVAGAGDVNGDGYSDVVIGAHKYDEGANADEGRAFVYYGSAGGLSASPDLILSDANMGDAQFGFNVACAGDINGDGYSDVIVSANLYDDGFINEGVVFIYYGSSTGLSATYNAIADDANQANANFGAKAACAGDVNGDGYSDVIIGAYTYDDNLLDEGVVFIYYGSSAGLSATPDCMLDDANMTAASFGYSVASAGDVNGDGYSDVIIGAYTYKYMTSIDYGLTYVYNGGPEGLTTTETWTIEGEQVGANMGFHISGVASSGDVNGDGFSDVMIGIPYYDNGQTDEGAVYVFYGSASGLSLIPDWTGESNQANSAYGRSVSFAGDVNGDGYGDIIIGASEYDGGHTNEGRAYVYHGSSSGLSLTPAWTAEKDQANALFGFCVASAGDINGDGYGDVVISTPHYDFNITDEGGAFLYYGSSTGLASSSLWNVYGGQTGCYFGHSVASAGDVNGDGFSDIIVGAHFYDNGHTDEGKVFVYYGSGPVLSTTANWTAEADIANAGFGVRVAAAGDVNGDGYGDVIIGAFTYSSGGIVGGAAFVYHGSSGGLNIIPNSTIGQTTQPGAFFGIVSSAGDINGDGYSDVLIGAFGLNNGAVAEGGAFVYKGSATGLNTSADWSVEANVPVAQMGYSVACAGDVNGDGYSDVLVGAHTYSNGQSQEGKVFLYYGNKKGGLRNNLRLYNSDLVTPIQQANMSDPNLFGAGLYAKSFIGRQKGKLVYQTVKNGVAFTGSPITNSTAYTSQQATFTDLGLNGVELKNQIAKQIPTKATYIRARVKYDLVTSITGQVYGPWRYPEGFMRGRRDVGSVALPVKFISFTAIKENGSVLLKWITTNEEAGVRFELQHSIDGINFTLLASFNGKNDARNEYEWLHTDPKKGNNFYRINAIENNKTVFSPTRLISFDDIFTTSIYPNPVANSQQLTIKNESIRKDKMISVSIFSMTGQVVWQKTVLASADGMLLLDIPPVPAAAYLLQIGTGQYTGKAKIWVKK